MRYKNLTKYAVFLTTMFIIASVVPSCLSTIPVRYPKERELIENNHYVMPDDPDDGDKEPYLPYIPPSNYRVASDSLTNDRDGDGVPDKYDVFPDDPNEWADFDGDGIGDNADPDDDNDFYLDDIEIKCGTNPRDSFDFPLDTDNDYMPDLLDEDDDNDGYLDDEDAFPKDPSEWADFDGDGIGDNADPDDDNDDVPDSEDAFPNNPFEWEDTDGDGTGDNSDTDDDNDGWTDLEEEQNGTDPKDPNDYPTDPVENEYVLTISIIGNGSVIPSEGLHVYTEGTNVIVSAMSDEGWDFDHWSGDDIDNSTNTIELIIMNSNKSVTAHFLKQIQLEVVNPEGENYTLTVNIEGNGTVELDPDQIDYMEGIVVELNASSDLGWNFSHWSGDDINNSTNATEYIIMNSNKSVTAHFIIIAEETPTTYDDPEDEEDDSDDESEADDMDGDGVPDDDDLDRDGDGIPNDYDVFPDDPNEWKDTDGDGIGDNEDADDDGDGYLDFEDAYPKDPDRWAYENSDNNDDTITDGTSHDSNNNNYNYNPKNSEDNTLFYMMVVAAFIIFILVCLFVIREKDEEIGCSDVKIEVFSEKNEPIESNSLDTPFHTNPKNTIYAAPTLHPNTINQTQESFELF